MRNLGKIAARIAGTMTLMMLVNFLIASEIDLRFHTARFDHNTHELYVEIQLKYTNEGQFILAGQNYRVYYDSEVLLLKTEEAKSKLPVNAYSPLAFEKHLHGVKADEINQLRFDDHLGFANFSIDLTDNLNGGLSITANDSWVTVALLKFDVLEENKRYDIVWGRESMSDKYATAYVEMAQWKSPTERERVTIVNYGDLTFEPGKLSIAEDIAIQVGPNPAIDFVQIKFGTQLAHDTDVHIFNTAGQIIASATASATTTRIQIEVAGLPGGTYLVEIVDEEEGSVMTQPIVIAK